jgi:hypothetical protein
MNILKGSMLQLQRDWTNINLYLEVRRIFKDLKFIEVLYINGPHIGKMFTLPPEDLLSKGWKVV